MARKEILHIIHGLTVGGAEVDLVNKILFLAERFDYNQTICCLMRRGKLASRVEAVGIPLVGPLMGHRYDPGVAARLRSLIRARPWDAIHSHLFAANLVTFGTLLTLPSSQRPRWIAAEHAMADRWGPLPLLIDRWLQRYVHSFLVPSRAAAESYARRGVPPSRTRVLYNGIDIERFQGIDVAGARNRLRQELNFPPECFLIGTVCRLEAVKGLPELLEAITPLPVSWIIIGDGSERERLAALIRQQGVEQRVRMVGTRADIPELLAAMDLFVLPSRSESFGIVVAEALLMEKPVIATRVGGIPEITCGDRYARLVPPGDVGALRKAIGWLLAHREEAARAARSGRAHIQATLSIEEVATRLHNIYEELA